MCAVQLITEHGSDMNTNYCAVCGHETFYRSPTHYYETLMGFHVRSLRFYTHYWPSCSLTAYAHLLLTQLLNSTDTTLHRRKFLFSATCPSFFFLRWTLFGEIFIKFNLSFM